MFVEFAVICTICNTITLTMIDYKPPSCKRFDVDIVEKLLQTFSIKFIFFKNNHTLKCLRNWFIALHSIPAQGNGRSDKSIPVPEII